MIDSNNNNNNNALNDIININKASIINKDESKITDKEAAFKDLQKSYNFISQEYITLKQTKEEVSNELNQSKANNSELIKLNTILKDTLNDRIIKNGFKDLLECYINLDLNKYFNKEENNNSNASSVSLSANKKEVSNMTNIKRFFEDISYNEKLRKTIIELKEKEIILKEEILSLKNTIKDTNKNDYNDKCINNDIYKQVNLIYNDIKDFVMDIEKSNNTNYLTKFNDYSLNNNNYDMNKTNLNHSISYFPASSNNIKHTVDSIINELLPKIRLYDNNKTHDIQHLLNLNNQLANKLQETKTKYQELLNEITIKALDNNINNDDKNSNNNNISSNKQNTYLEETFNQCKNENKLLKEEYDHIKNELELATRAISKYNQEIESLQKQYEYNTLFTNKNNQRDIDKLNEELGNLVLYNDSLKEKYDNSLKKINQLTVENSNYKDQINYLQETIDNSLVINTKLNSKITNLKTIIENNDIKNKEVEMKISESLNKNDYYYEELKKQEKKENELLEEKSLLNEYINYLLVLNESFFEEIKQLREFYSLFIKLCKDKSVKFSVFNGEVIFEDIERIRRNVKNMMNTGKILEYENNSNRIDNKKTIKLTSEDKTGISEYINRVSSETNSFINGFYSKIDKSLFSLKFKETFLIYSNDNNTVITELKNEINSLEKRLHNKQQEVNSYKLVEEELLLKEKKLNSYLKDLEKKESEMSVYYNKENEEKLLLKQKNQSLNKEIVNLNQENILLNKELLALIGQKKENNETLNEINTAICYFKDRVNVLEEMVKRRDGMIEILGHNIDEHLQEKIRYVFEIERECWGNDCKSYEENELGKVYVYYLIYH